MEEHGAKGRKICSVLLISLATVAKADLSREDAIFRAGELSAVIGYCTDDAPDELWSQSDLMHQYVNIGDYEDDLWELHDNGAQRGANLVVNLGCTGAINDLMTRLDNYRF